MVSTLIRNFAHRQQLNSQVVHVPGGGGGCDRRWRRIYLEVEESMPWGVPWGCLGRNWRFSIAWMLSKVNQEVYPEVGEGVSGDWDDVLTWRLRGCTHLEVQEGVLTWMFRRVFICRFGRCTHLEVGEGVLIWRFGRVYSPGGSQGCTHLEVWEGVFICRFGRVYSLGGWGGCTHLEVREGVLTWRFRSVYSFGGSGGCTHLEVGKGAQLQFARGPAQPVRTRVAVRQDRLGVLVVQEEVNSSLLRLKIT